MKALSVELATTSVLKDKAASVLCETQNYDAEEREAAAQLLVLLRNDQMPKVKKTYRRRRGKKVVETKDVQRAAVVIQDRIQNYELPEIITLLGECLFYESLFIWQKVSIDQCKINRCMNTFGLIADILLVIQHNYKWLLKLLMELPSVKSSKHYPVIVRSEDVSNLALKRGRRLVLDLVTTRVFTSINDICLYCVEKIKLYSIPIDLIMKPIEETFRNCLHIVPEDHNSS